MLRISIKSSYLAKSAFAFVKYNKFNPLLARYCQTSTGSEGRNCEGSSSEKKALKRCEFCKDYDEIKDEFETLKKDNESLLDKYRRALAEIENSRKRSERQVEEAKTFAIQGFCKDLLEVADVLNIAVDSLEKEMAKDESLKNVYQGINMTKNSLLKAFEKHGLVQIVPEGQKFDPNLHEAVFEVPEEQSKHRPGHVSHVLNIGYSLHNRPVRPAKVGVVKTICFLSIVEFCILN